MAKPKSSKILVSDLVNGSIFKLPSDFKADQVVVSKISDLANDNSLGAVVKGRNSLVTVTATSGPFKGSTAAVILGTSDEIELIKHPKKKILGVELWASASVFALLCVALVYSDTIVKWL